LNTPIRNILIVLSVTVVVAFILTLFNYDDCNFNGKYQFSGSDGETTIRPITYYALHSNTDIRQLGESGDYYLVVNSSGINWKILIWDIEGTL
jgi:hypothetical protein